MWLIRYIIKSIYWLLGVDKVVNITYEETGIQISGLKIKEIPKIGELVAFDDNEHFLVTNILHKIKYYQHIVFIMIVKKK